MSTASANRRLRGTRAYVVSSLRMAAKKNAQAKQSSSSDGAAPAASKGFAGLVRRSAESVLPNYRFVGTSGGSGPVVTFHRPSEHERLRELVVFQKGLRGSDWFRVNFIPMFVGAGTSGSTMEHELAEGTPLGPDVHWSTDAELASALAATCAGVEARAAQVFEAYERAYPAFEALFGDLVEHYSSWFSAKGHELPLDAFVENDAGAIIAFDVWKASLEGDGLFEGIASDLLTPLWRFWHNGRPMRREDYRRDDYYDCSRCGAFTSFARGTLVKAEDTTFGEHYVFVCKKH
ncbi:MAG: hypothetical protein QM784_09165 [Polyangiaceae bacterium]